MGERKEKEMRKKGEKMLWKIILNLFTLVYSIYPPFSL